MKKTYLSNIEFFCRAQNKYPFGILGALRSVKELTHLLVNKLSIFYDDLVILPFFLQNNNWAGCCFEISVFRACNKNDVHVYVNIRVQDTWCIAAEALTEDIGHGLFPFHSPHQACKYTYIKNFIYFNCLSWRVCHVFLYIFQIRRWDYQ